MGGGPAHQHGGGQSVSGERARRRGRWGLLVSVGISVLLIILLYLKAGVRLERLAQEWSQASAPILALAMLLSVGIHVFMGGHKLWLLVRWLGVKIPLRDIFLARLGEGPLRLIIPFKGGDLAAALFLNRQGGAPLGEAAGAVLFDRVLNLLGTSTWLLIGLALAPGLLPGGGAAVVGVVLVAGLALLMSRPLHNLLTETIRHRLPEKLSEALAGLLSPWRTLNMGARLALMGYTLIYVSRPMILCALIAAAFSVEVPPARLMVYTNLALFAGLVPGPLMGIGPREATLEALLARELPAGSGAGLSVAFLLTAAMYLVPLLVGLPLVPWFLRRLVRTEEGAEGAK